jgi:hypothetical protein
MEGLDIRLQKRINASLYTLIFLTGLLGISVLFESCQGKQEVKMKLSVHKDITLQNEVR